MFVGFSEIKTNEWMNINRRGIALYFCERDTNPYDTIDDLHWKTDRQADQFNLAHELKEN